MKTSTFANDAFSSGQVGSKLWLCEELEPIMRQRAKEKSQDETVWIYGGWQGVMGFLLLSRASFPVHNIRSFDIDASCASNANVLCDNWYTQDWKFLAKTGDCNELYPDRGTEHSSPATVVINTSVEHFDGRAWFENIPKGTLVALQASDFEHDGAVFLFPTAEKLAEAYPLGKTLFKGEKKFEYATWSFTRLMVIGVR